jgi:hypothetical protein
MFISTYLTKYPYLENIVTFSNILDSFGKENQNSKIDLFIRKLELNGSRQDIKALIEKLEKIKRIDLKSQTQIELLEMTIEIKKIYWIIYGKKNMG